MFCHTFFLVLLGCAGLQKTLATHTISSGARDLERVNPAIVDVTTNSSGTHLRQARRSFNSKELYIGFAAWTPDLATGEDWIVDHGWPALCCLRDSATAQQERPLASPVLSLLDALGCPLNHSP